MVKSKRVRLSDIRRVYQIINEIVEMGDDPDAWRMHLVTQTHRLFGLQMSHAWVAPWPMSSANGRVGKIAQFGMDDKGSRMWLKYAAKGDFTSNPCSPAIERFSDKPLTGVRRTFTTDQDWYQSGYFNEFRRQVQSDDLLISVLPIPELGIAHGFGGDRPMGSDPMGRREIVCSALIHQELHRRWKRLLNRPSAVGKNLPPRLGELLRHLRGPDSEKQIALKMELSIHTVHNHVRRLYGRFNVSSRAELILADNAERLTGVPQLGCAGL